jgi:hypothetical protein
MSPRSHADRDMPTALAASIERTAKSSVSTTITDFGLSSSMIQLCHRTGCGCRTVMACRFSVRSIYQGKPIIAKKRPPARTSPRT